MNATTLNLSGIKQTMVTAVVLFAAMVMTKPAMAGQAVLTPTQSAGVIDTIRAHGGVRIPCGQVINPTTNEVEEVQYQDILSIDGTAHDNNGTVVTVVTLSEVKRVVRTPVIQYQLVYTNPGTGQQVAYMLTPDLNYANQVLRWLQQTYPHVAATGAAVQTGWALNYPPLVTPSIKTMTMPPTTGTAPTTPSGPGLLGVPMGG